MTVEGQLRFVLLNTVGFPGLMKQPINQPTNQKVSDFGIVREMAVGASVDDLTFGNDGDDGGLKERRRADEENNLADTFVGTYTYMVRCVCVCGGGVS